MNFAAGCAGWISGVGVMLAGEMGGLGSWTRFSFLIHFVLISSRGKFSFCQFAEKKNRGTGRKLAISWKSKLPSAAETGASYFQKMAQALPSSIMHSGIQNRNKEMALDPKNTPFVVYMNPRKIQFDLSLAQLQIVPMRFFRILVQYRTFLLIGSSAWWIRYDLSDYKKKKLWSVTRISFLKKCVLKISLHWAKAISLVNLFYNWSLLLIGFQVLHWIRLRSNN